MNKYTRKLLDILRGFPDIHKVPSSTVQFPIIARIKKCVTHYLLSTTDHTLSAPVMMQPINTSNQPLMYKMLSQLYPDKVNNYNSFIGYYKGHQRDFDMPTIIKTYQSQSSNLLDPNIMNILNKLSEPAYMQLYNELIYSGSFVSLDNQFHAEQMSLVYQVAQNDKVAFHIYYKDTMSVNIHELFAIYNIVECLSTHKNNKKHNITLFLGKQKKYINPNDCAIGPYNINSGVTISYETIGIWREEEIYKVLIHELVHLFGFDHMGNEARHELEHTVTGHFCMNNLSTDSPNESYTEFLTLLIHSMIISEQYNIPYDVVLTNETQFSLFQIAKLMNHYGLQTANEMISPTECIVHLNVQTSVISYFVIKLLFLLNITKMLEFIGDNPYIYDKIDTFGNLIEEFIGQDHQLINTYASTYANLPNNTDHYVLQTGRMSLYGKDKDIDASK